MGSDSDRPTNPPPHDPKTEAALRAMLARSAPAAPKSVPPKKQSLVDVAKLYGPTLMSIITAAGSAYAFAQNEVDSRIKNAVAQHDEDLRGTSHGKLREKITTLEEKLTATINSLAASQERTRDLDKALYEIYWLYVGDKAAELENDKRKAQQSAARARDKFERLVADGVPMQDAHRRALSGWYGNLR